MLDNYRNCLVGAGYTLKICDWALLRSTYTACYYRTQADEALPLRWMAWEAFLMVS
jgi:discoidin domain receptor family protein 2